MTDDNNQSAEQLITQINTIVQALLKNQYADTNLPCVEQTGGLNEELESIYNGLLTFRDMIEELSAYSHALSKGCLDTPFPPRNNYLAGGIKALHSNLLHLNWKVSQVSKGDYSQTIDFMGEFSDTFNSMANKLRLREIQLAEAQSLTRLILEYTDTLIVALRVSTNELVYAKENKQNIYDQSQLSDEVRHIIELLVQNDFCSAEDTAARELYCDVGNRWYTVSFVRSIWYDSEPIYFYMLLDITEHKAEQENLKQHLYIDQTTKAFNRAYAFDKLHELIGQQELFSLMYADLDNLKVVNDTYGHRMGDTLLSRFVDCVQECIRAQDTLCRMGGDEFLLICPGITLETMHTITERIKHKIAHANQQGNDVFQILFSYGLEESTNMSGRTPEGMLEIVDQKMYSHKKKKHKKPLQ